MYVDNKTSSFRTLEFLESLYIKGKIVEYLGLIFKSYCFYSTTEFSLNDL